MSAIPREQGAERLDEVIAHCQPLVVRICRSRLSGRPLADIEDAIQDALIALSQAPLDKIRNVEAWTTRVAYRVCAHSLRQRYRSPFAALLEEAAVDTSYSPTERIDEQVFIAKVASLLPTTDLTLLHLLYIEDRTYAEVADYLHVSNANARVLAHRARLHAHDVISQLD